MFKSRLIFMVVAFLFVLSSGAFAATPQRRGVMISPTVTAADLQYLGQTWNVNVVRWQLNWSGGKASSATPQAYDAWLEGALQSLDSLLPTCQKYGLKVIVDLHSTPGGNNAAGESTFLKDAAAQTKFLEVWKKIAQRYAGNTTVWGYDLANEPAQISVPAGVLTWHQVATIAAQNIRAVDATHTIIVEPLLWGKANGFVGFQPLPSTITNVVYSVHMYYPNDFTHQGVNSTYSGFFRYPGVINKKMWNKAQLRASLQPVIDFQQKYGVPILVGEFSAVRWAPAGSAYNYLRDCISIFEENGWDWIYHAFREYNGWSVEHTEDKNNNDVAKRQTTREKLLRSFFVKNRM